MKKLLLVAVVGLGLTSCSKGDFVFVDKIDNQGQSVVLVNGLAVEAGDQIILDHVDSYSVVCTDDCKVNINGAIYYESGVYKNETKQKQY